MFSLIFINSCNGSMIGAQKYSDKIMGDHSLEFGATLENLSLSFASAFSRHLDGMINAVESLLVNPSVENKEKLKDEIMGINLLAGIYDNFLAQDTPDGSPKPTFKSTYGAMGITKNIEMLINRFDLDYPWMEEMYKEQSLMYCKIILDRPLTIKSIGSIGDIVSPKFLKLDNLCKNLSLKSSSLTIEKAAEILTKMSEENINADLIEKEYSKILGLEKLTDKWKDNFKSIKDLFESISKDIELCAKLAKEKSLVTSTKATEDKDLKISLELVKADEKIKNSLNALSVFELVLTEEEVQIKVQKAMDTLKAAVKKKLDKRLQEKKEKDDAIKAIKDDRDRRNSEEEKKAAEEKRLKEGKYNLVLGKAFLKKEITPEEDTLVLGEGKNTLEFKIISNAKNQVAILSNNIFYEKRNKKRKIDQLIDKNNENIRLDKGKDGKISMTVKDINGKQKTIKLKIVKSDQSSSFNLKSDYYNKDFDGIN